ncbi:SPS-sensor component Ptr3p [[Candida] railenensis]|uniref:SPS-sensor component Ptr3p n=1 Tax=[Candida] railenensis TaxID=45579 RepID=A0A9P0QTN2_9ASCO|nr:SPS-sensor component Ptr3p [[Candida] railenensis]
MDRHRLEQLENLLRVQRNSKDVVADMSVLTCGCLTSESYFGGLSHINGFAECPNCGSGNVTLLADVSPMRALYKIVLEISTQLKEQQSAAGLPRKSISKKSLSENISAENQYEQSSKAENMNLISLFYKFAKEETEREVVSKRKNRKSADYLELQRQSSLHQSQQEKETLKSDLISQHFEPEYTTASSVQPINISTHSSAKRGNSSAGPGPETSIIPSSLQSFSISPMNDSSYTDSSFRNSSLQTIPSQLLLGKGGEEKEYNFSKCFPFYRKLSTFQTQQTKLNFSSFSSSFKASSMIKKTTKFIGSDIHSYIDMFTGEEITRFVMISEKKWELYQYDNTTNKPKLLCCGKSTGEYGRDHNSLSFGDGDEEILIKNDFGDANANTNATSNSNNGNANNNYDTNGANGDTLGTNDYDNNDETRKKLATWDQLYCSLSTNYLTISGTKGILRVLNVSPRSMVGDLGKPLYTYMTNFPIRCIAISPNEKVVACGITARERLTGKEQPFIILHKLNLREDSYKVDSVEPITITVPYRDPIKMMNFNATSKYLLCCTVWESRYLIIRLTSNASDNYKKPRLIWSELSNTRKRSVDMKDGKVDMESKNKEEDEIMMGNEGITDLQFGSTHSNTIIMASCSLTNRPPVVIRLDGVPIDGGRPSISNGTGGAGGMGDYETSSMSANSNNFRNMELEEERNASNSIKSSEPILRIPEVGSTIHRFASSPRGDGMCYLDKEGHIFLVSTPNFQPHPTTPMKKIVVQLGEVSNAERYYESAAIKFSIDGGKVYVVDRKGIFSVFDFTKGIPGQDMDVVKCKIVNI